MDPITSNFILTVIGISVGAIATIIGALSKCMMKSRCSNIKCCGSECIREVLSEQNEIYTDTQSNSPKE